MAKRLTPQAQAILKHMEDGNGITPLEALGVYGVFRLAARIGEIRDQGHTVITEYKKDYRGKTYARYCLGKFFTTSIKWEQEQAREVA